MSSIFQGNIFGTGENPLVTAARGELFVPIGDEDHPPVAKRILIVACSIVVLLGAILFVNRLYRQSITLPERNSAMIGHSINELEDVPGTVTYADVEFAYNVTDFEGIITGCTYTAKGNLDELNAVIHGLLKRYDSPDDFDKVALTELTEGNLSTLGIATWTWNYGKRKVESLEALDNWGKSTAKRYTVLYMDLTIDASADGEVDILIRYEVRRKTIS